MVETASASRGNLTAGKLVLYIALLVVIGLPMVYILWDAVNHLLTGHIGDINFVLVLPVLAVFAVFVYVLARLVRRWEATPER